MPMFISTFNAHLEKVDPYYTQRIIFRKGLYIGVLALIFYLIFQPKEGYAYVVTPFLGFFIFELPAFNTYKKKYAALIFGYGSAIIFSSLFILLSPYRWLLFFTGLVCFFLFCYLTIKYLRMFKMIVIPFFLISIAFISTEPLGSLQAMKGVVFAMSLALFVVIIGYKTHQNLYLNVWYRALKISFKRMQKNLKHLLDDEHICYDPTVMLSINTMAEYKRIIPATNLLNVLRVVVNTRNLNMTIIYLRSVDIDKEYWQLFMPLLDKFIQSLEDKTEFDCTLITHSQLAPKNVHQRRGYQHFLMIAKNWNKLCTQV